jgi:hypothetical protein
MMNMTSQPIKFTPLKKINLQVLSLCLDNQIFQAGITLPADN